MEEIYDKIVNAKQLGREDTVLETTSIEDTKAYRRITTRRSQNISLQNI